MPSGAVHYNIYRRNYPIVVAVSAVFLYFYLPFGAGIILGYFLLGRYLDPDLDQISVTSADGRMMRELKIFGVLLSAYYMVYAYTMRMFGGHRSFITHAPILSTVIRLAWLLVIPAAIAFYFGYKPDIIVLQLLAGVFWGLAYADLIHILRDWWRF